MRVKDLKPNAKNPRKISNKKLDALKKSISKFGDLSGFVFNRRSKTLISGHQRQKSIPQDATIKIEVKHEKPTKANTVAEGYVEIDGERFKYREVDADPTWEMEALLAANKHSGEWDKDLLKLAVIDLPDIDLEIAGFDDMEIESLDLPKISIDDNEEEEEQEEDIDKGAHQSEAFGDEEESDEEYLENNPGPDTSLEKERIPSMVNDAFEKIEEKTEIVNKRFVIIIDCPNEETKQSLRDQLKDLIKESGAKIF